MTVLQRPDRALIARVLREVTRDRARAKQRQAARERLRQLRADKGANRKEQKQ